MLDIYSFFNTKKENPRDRYHSIILDSYENKMPDYNYKIEDMLCVACGEIFKKVEILRRDFITDELTVSIPQGMNLSSWDINFILSLVKKSVINKLPLTTRQLSCLKKINFDFIDEDYRVGVYSENLKRRTRESFSRERKVFFVIDSIIGITLTSDSEINNIVRETFWNSQHSIKHDSSLIGMSDNILYIPLGWTNIVQLEILLKYGYKIDNMVYDIHSLMGEVFFEYSFDEQTNNISLIDSEGFTSSLIKTLLITGNVS